MRILLLLTFIFHNLAIAQIDSSSGSGSGKEFSPETYGQFSQQYNVTCDNVALIAKNIKKETLKLLGVKTQNFAKAFDKNYPYYKKFITFLEVGHSEDFQAPMQECSDCKIKSQKIKDNIFILFELDKNFAKKCDVSILNVKEKEILSVWFPELFKPSKKKRAEHE